MAIKSYMLRFTHEDKDRRIVVTMSDCEMPAFVDNMREYVGSNNFDLLELTSSTRFDYSAALSLVHRIVTGVALLAVLLMAGCAQNPVETKSTNNPNFQVELLFDHEGCKMYRFYDEGRYIWYSHCVDSTHSQVTWNENDKAQTLQSVPTN